MGTAGMLFSMARLSGKRPGSVAAAPTWPTTWTTSPLIADDPLPFQVDGDALDFREKVTFRSVPDAISVVVPPHL